MEMDRSKKPASARYPPPWDCGSPLYDSFELASVYGVLDSHLMALPFARRSPSRDGGNRVARDADVAVVAAGTGRRTSTRRAGAGRRRRAAARRTGIKAVLHSICRTVTCTRKL